MPDLFEGIGLIYGAINYGWTYHIATLDCGSGREIEIRADWWYEGTRAMGYQVHEYGVERFEYLRGFQFVQGSVDTDSLRYDVIATTDSSVFAVTEMGDPHVVLILHDFDNGWSWADGWDTLRRSQRRRVADMLRRVQASHPGRSLGLNGFSKEELRELMASGEGAME